MLSKAQIKLIQSLKFKKFRDLHGLFVAEGVKAVNDLLKSGLVAKSVFALIDVINEIESFDGPQNDPVKVEELKKISFLSSSTKVLGLFEIPKLDISVCYKDEFLIALDGVQDPGNLGTIIRLADWYGIKNIVCSNNCVDAYNPKVIQATMGSIARINVHYIALEKFIKVAKNQKEYKVYGSFMEGASIYQTTFNDKKILIMGNEGKGISNEVENLIDDKISIPAFFSGNNGPESLNVSIATAIMVSEMIRMKHT